MKINDKLFFSTKKILSNKTRLILQIAIFFLNMFLLLFISFVGVNYQKNSLEAMNKNYIKQRIEINIDVLDYDNANYDFISDNLDKYCSRLTEVYYTIPDTDSDYLFINYKYHSNTDLFVSDNFVNNKY